MLFVVVTTPLIDCWLRVSMGCGAQASIEQFAMTPERPPANAQGHAETHQRLAESNSRNGSTGRCSCTQRHFFYYVLPLICREAQQLRGAAGVVVVPGNEPGCAFHQTGTVLPNWQMCPDWQCNGRETPLPKRR